MRTVVLGGVAAILMLATPALAAPAKPTEEQKAAAKAVAERLIVATGRPADFSFFITGTARTVIIHNPSGARCGFDGAPGEKLELIAATAEHGEGVRCVTDNSSYPTTVEVVEGAKGTTLEMLVAASKANDKVRLGDVTVVKTGPKGRARIPMKDRELKHGAAGEGYSYVADTVIGRWMVTIRVEDLTTREGFKADTAEFVGQLQVILAQDVIKP